MLYPIGLQNFEDIRRKGYVYVDKTGHIFRLGVNFSTLTRRIDGWKVL